MERKASLRLILVTRDGEPLRQRVNICLRNEAAGESRSVQEDAACPILVEDLLAFANEPYLLEIRSASFRAETRVCERLKEGLNELCIIFRRCDDDDRDCPPLKIADHLDEKTLATHLTGRLAGTPADGSAAPAQAPTKVLWIDGGDEVLVHLDSMQTIIRDGVMLVSLDLEADQTGRATMVASFAVARAGGPAGLIAVAEDFPRGNGVLASRWGRPLLAAVWSSLLGLATDHATERFASPLGISATNGTLLLMAGAALKVRSNTASSEIGEAAR